MPIDRRQELNDLRTRLHELGDPWQAGHTTLTDLTDEERRAHLGARVEEIGPDELERRSAAALAAHRREASAANLGLAPSFDLRDVSGVDYTTAVKDQGNCRSCVAFGTAATLEHVSRYQLRSRDDLDLSEAQLAFCHDTGDPICAHGWSAGVALDAAAERGVTLERLFRYTDHEQSCTVDKGWQDFACRPMARRGLTSDIASMKSYLVNYGSIPAVMDVYTDFFSYAGGIYRHVSGGYEGSHLVTIVGYDDVHGCWLAKNSWATGWGEHGFFRIEYGGGGTGIESMEVYGVPGTMLINRPSGDLGLTEVAVDPRTHATLAVANGSMWQRSSALLRTGSLPGAPAKRITVGKDPRGVAVNAGRRRAYVANGGDRTLTVVNLDDYGVVATVSLPGNGNPTAVAVDPDSEGIWVCADNGDVTVLREDNTIDGTFSIARETGRYAIAIDYNPRKVYVANQSAAVVLALDGTTVPIPVERAPYAVAVDSRTKKVYVTHPSAKAVTVISGRSNQAIARIDLDEMPGSLAVDPLMRTVYVVHQAAGTLTMIDVDSDHVIGTIRCDEGGILGVAVDPVTHFVHVVNYYTGRVTVLGDPRAAHDAEPRLAHVTEGARVPVSTGPGRPGT